MNQTQSAFEDEHIEGCSSCKERRAVLGNPPLDITKERDSAKWRVQHLNHHEHDLTIIRLCYEFERLRAEIKHHQTHHAFEHRSCFHTVPHGK